MIHYVVGDATYPVGIGSKIIAHVCNNVGGWGKGFVLSISKRWQMPELMYRHWHSTGECPLGETGFVPVVQTVDELIIVANMVAQDGYKTNSRTPICYEALRKCLTQVATEARDENCSVHMPRIGCGLAGGKWEIIEEIINDVLNDVEVYVYDLPTK